MSAIYWVDPLDQSHFFPDVSRALEDPNGLLAIGGDLSPERLLSAYKNGIFPWFSDDQPILWWSPDPRSVLFPDQLNISRSLRKALRKKIFRITMNHDFAAVIHACANTPRQGQDGTWITDDIMDAYHQLHALGYAHSIEAWQGDQLCGGLYGVSMGSIFFGESMFMHKTDASKIAFAHLTRWMLENHYQLIDCQVETEHLNSLGAENIPRKEFIRILERNCSSWNATPMAGKRDLSLILEW